MNISVSTQGFWQRQFAVKATPKQLAFDVFMGIFAPILCIKFDPMVFNELLPSSQVFVYSIIGLEIATLALWLLLGTHLKLLAGFIGGILLSGALFSFVIGIFLLPLSILGLILIVGILGFTPFFTCFVFLRNGVRALGQANEKISVTSLVMGMSLVIAVQGGIQWAQIISESSQSVTRTDDILSTQQAKRQFKSWCTDNYLNKIVLIYAKETDPSRKKVIAKLYQDITGENIEERLWNLSDR
jgi:hypothetical protein